MGYRGLRMMGLTVVYCLVVGVSFGEEASMWAEDGMEKKAPQCDDAVMQMDLNFLIPEIIRSLTWSSSERGRITAMLAIFLRLVRLTSASSERFPRALPNSVWAKTTFIAC
jgi:hypothetical protein